MILAFSTKIKGKPTYFPEKILMGLLVKKLTPESDFNSICPRGVIIPKGDIMYNIHFEHTINHKPKYHTIREDKNDRWKVGTKIDFFINARQKNMYRFAPVLPVVSVQEIEIIWFNKTRSLEPSKYDPKRFNYLDLIVDDRLLEINEVEKLAQNDGFDTIEDFFDYFDKYFKGKIIHWTDYKY